MNTTKLKFIVSAAITLITLSTFGWQQYRQFQRMMVIRTNTSTVAEAPIQTQQNTPPPVEASGEPESTAPVNAPKPNEPKGEATEEVIAKLVIDDPNDQKPYYALATTPNDPIYPQWYTTNISAPTAWDISRGSADFTVAVVDTGFALEHEDLNSAWLINTNEQGMTQLSDACWTGVAANKQTNNCDDDENGYIDDWRGWDFSNDDNNSQAGDDSQDGATHGSKVAGLVGARSNNGVGVAAINWNSKIMPLQAMFDEGVGYSIDIAEAIVYAVDNGADVVNLSLGGPSPDSIIRAAMIYANDRNVIVVAASGNCGADQTTPECTGTPSPGGMTYPARYNEAIAVGAVTSTDAIASFSSYGPELDIVAPGSGTIRTPTWTSGNSTTLYSDTSFGTSFASPIVAGLVGVIKSEFPDLSKDEVLALLINGTDKVSGMGSNNRTDIFGYGRIDAEKTLLEIAKYREQLDKTGGVAGSLALQDNTPPLVSSNIGHSSESQITTSSYATTYCVTTPNTPCTLALTKDGTSNTVSLGSKISNAQGIAYWQWSRSDVSSTGTWNAKVTSNSLDSVAESLIVN